MRVHYETSAQDTAPFGFDTYGRMINSGLGGAAMWDLTVAHVHTFAMGTGQFVVHNCAKQVNPDDQARWDKYRGKYETRDLPDGRTRFYDTFTLSRTPGPTAGGRFGGEFNPVTGERRSWYEETYALDRSVRAVQPKTIADVVVDLPHYWFDHGDFLGAH